MEHIHWNDNWQFTPSFTPALSAPDFMEGALETVRIPHTLTQMPYNYCNEKDYQMTAGYRKVLFAPATWQGKQVFLRFDAVGHHATVYCNGTEVAQHHSGYTAFTIALGEHLQYDAENIIVVKCDSHETLNQPPFGHAIDYMTFGGIYRPVHLEIKESTYLQDVFVTAEADGNFRIYPTIKGDVLGCTLHAEITAPDGQVSVLKGDAAAPLKSALHNVTPWHPDTPALYTLTLGLIRQGSAQHELPDYLLDEVTVRFGFRTLDFKADGLYLNGKKIHIRGLNRHQSYPYQGYAMPDSQQWLDAGQLKFELGCNAVRTSHYPQSQAFLNACDTLGLLVFTEMPGWQHIGDTKWKQIALQNCREMVLQYRNHPSIFLWGARINESADDDSFYRKTNEVIHRLDPTRPTGGVRCIKDSSCFEDVYTYNDFVHSGKNEGCQPKRAVTSSLRKGYLVTEYNGHMFPTKPSDHEARRLEHALRHAKVLEDIAAQKEIAGSFGWCMFDYNTHKDFGAGDRICYHGVLDMFRNPKLAAAVYASQKPLSQGAVLEISNSMSIGDHDACVPGELWAFTNADYIALYKNDAFIASFAPNPKGKHAHLPHPPILIDDLIGNVLVTDEGYTPAAAKDIKECLNAFCIYGTELPAALKLKFAKTMVQHKLTMADATRLHGKCIGNWGELSVRYRFDAIANGKVVASVTKEPADTIALEATVRNDTLTDGPTWDCASVLLRAVDQNGNVLPYCNEVVTLQLEGPATLIGPAAIPLRGGFGGTYVATTGKAGEITLTCTMAGAAPVTLHITAQVR